MHIKQINTLLIESDPGDARLIEEMLKKEDAQQFLLTHFEHLQPGLEFTKQNQVDLILLDPGYPDNQGEETVAQALNKIPGIPIIVLISKNNPQFSSTALRLGAQNILIKEYITSDLIKHSIRLAIERKMSQSALAQEKAQLSALINSIGEAVIASDTSCVITGMNPAAEALTGWSEVEAVGRPFSEVYPIVGQESQHPLQCPVRQILDSGKVSSRDEQVLLVSKDGRKIPVSDTATLVKDPDGKTTGAVLIIHDETDQRAAQRLLQEERNRAQKYLDIAGVMILTLDKEGVITGINRKGAQVLGYSMGELVGKDWFAVCVPADDEQRARSAYAEFIAGKNMSGKHYQQAVITKDGAERILDCVSVELLDENRKIIGTIISGEDITERILTEQALKENAQSLRNILENSTEMFYTHTIDKIFTFVSPQSKQILGFDPEELIGQPTSVIIDPNQNNEEVINTDQAVRTGVHQPSFELLLTTKKGRQVWAEVRELPIIENGKTISIVGSIHDITVRKIAEDERERNITALQAVNADLQNSYERIQHTMESAIRAIAKIVEVRDPYTAGHHKRVSKLAVAIAKQMDLGKEIIKSVELAGAIHDLGKIQVPAEILSKPGKLTDIEFSMIKTHSAVGYQLLKDIEFPWPLAEIIYQHHERMDGSGYPRGLKGNKISIEGRILAVADTVEAMSSHRPYRPAFAVHAALKQIKADRGTLFDAQVVDACLAIFKNGYQLSENYK